MLGAYRVAGARVDATSFNPDVLSVCEAGKVAMAERQRVCAAVGTSMPSEEPKAGPTGVETVRVETGGDEHKCRILGASFTGLVCARELRSRELCRGRGGAVRRELAIAIALRRLVAISTTPRRVTDDIGLRWIVSADILVECKGRPNSYDRRTERTRSPSTDRFLRGRFGECTLLMR
jgi:hypothetical protein